MQKCDSVPLGFKARRRESGLFGCFSACTNDDDATRSGRYRCQESAEPDALTRRSSSSNMSTESAKIKPQAYSIQFLCSGVETPSRRRCYDELTITDDGFDDDDCHEWLYKLHAFERDEDDGAWRSDTAAYDDGTSVSPIYMASSRRLPHIDKDEIDQTAVGLSRTNSRSSTTSGTLPYQHRVRLATRRARCSSRTDGAGPCPMAAAYFSGTHRLTRRNTRDRG